MTLKNNIEPRNNNTETESFQQKFEHIKKEIEELSDTDGSNDIVEGVDGMLNEDFSNYLKQNPKLLDELLITVDNIKNTSDSNLIKLHDFLKENKLINEIAELIKIDNKEIKSHIDSTFSEYGYKIGNKITFVEHARDVIKKAIGNGNFNNTLLDDLKSIEKTDYIKFDAFLESYLEDENNITFTIPYGTQLHGDLSQSKYLTTCVSYYPDSFGKDCKLPKGFKPKKVFKKGKSIGLGIDAVHDKGYNGAGIRIGVIDNPSAPHDDLHIPVENIRKSGAKNHFHGLSVESIIAGQKNGVAPGVSLYYAESLSQTYDKDIGKNFERYNDKNIKAISMSFNLYQPWMLEKEEIKKGTKDSISQQVKNFKEKGIWVLSGEEFIKNFGILGKINPMGDPNDFKNYQVTWPDKRSIDKRKKLLDPAYNPKTEGEKYERDFIRDFYNNKEINIENLIFINSGDRTVADVSPDGKSIYRHDAIGGTSWTIPAVTSYYALACQADPKNMNPERFMQLAKDTAKKVQISSIPNDMKNMTKGRVPMNTEIKILDIKALIQKIEEEKNK